MKITKNIEKISFLSEKILILERGWHKIKGKRLETKKPHPFGDGHGFVIRFWFPREIGVSLGVCDNHIHD